MYNFTPSKYKWMSWTAYVLRKLRRGDVRSAGNMLCCCYPDELDDSEESKLLAQEWCPKMFGHPEVLNHAQELWQYMLEEQIAPEYTEEIRSRLRSYGWNI